MADSSRNPQDQAALEALKAQLQQLSGEFRALQQTIQADLAKEAEARQQGLAEQRAVARETVERRAVVSEAGAARGGATTVAEAEQLARKQASVADSASVGARTSDQFATSLERQRRSMAALDDSLTRHGALTTEWLGALARGEVTLREFGNQALQTIGKFSGWALAAGGVYAVIGALDNVRKGAIDTSSAVQGLTRFVPNLNRGEAQQQIIEQAQTTVTPVKDVGDAAQSFARIFKNQGDIFTATHVALTASKLDNIDLANSYRYLTALTQEYGLSASDLPGIFDQVTAAQDRLGARVSELLPALARSAAAIKNSGGDINQALALEALTIVRTGQTGNTIGTGFSRGASNFYKAPTSQATLQRFGIDPKQGFTQALIQAIGLGPELSGDQRREISKSFFGPLRGGQLASLFNASPQQVQQFIGQTSPDSSRGLANRQLATVTSQADQQIKQLGIDMETLGASLAQSGLLTDLGILIKALNSFLQATTGLLQVYNGLPATVKEVAGAFVGLGAVLAGLRRFGVIDQLQSYRKDETAYLNSAIGSARDDSRLLARQGLSQSRLSTYYAGQAGAAGAAGDTEAQAQYLELRKASVQREKEIAGRQLALQNEINQLETNLAETKSASRSQLREQRAAVEAQAAEDASAARGTTFIGGSTAADTRAVEGSTAALSAHAEVMGADAVATEEATAATAGFVAASTAALGAVRGFIFGLGGLAAAAGGYAVLHGNSELNRQTSQGINSIDKAKTAQQVLDAANKARNPQGLSAKIADAANRIFNVLPGGDPFDQVRKQIDAAAQAKINELGASQDEHNAGLGKLNEIYRTLGAGLASTSNAAAKVRDIKRAIAELGNDKALQAADPSGFAAARARLEDQLGHWTKSKKDIAAYVQTFNRIQQFTAYEAGTQQIFDIQGPSSNEGYTRASATLTALAEKMSQASPKNIQKYLTEYKKVSDQIGQEASTELQNALTLASSDPTAQAAARSQYLQRLQEPIRQTQTQLNAVARRLADDQKQAADARRQLDQLEHGPEGLLLKLIDPVAYSGEVGKLQGKIGNFGVAATKNNQEATLLRELLKQQQQDYKVAQEQMREANEQARLSLIQAQTALQQASTADPVTQAQEGLAGAAKALQQFEQSGIHDPVQRLQLLTQQRSAALQVVNAQLTRYEAQQSLNLAEANYGQSQEAQLQNNIGYAEQEVAHLRSLGSQIDPTKLLEAEKAVIDARQALADYMKQQAKNMIEAAGALAAARANDPVQKALAELHTAEQVLKYDQAHGASPDQIKQDMATVINDRRAAVEAQWQKQESTIQFLASTYQITGAQELTRLKKLYESMKKAHASYQDLQRVASEIFNLEFGQGDLNLNTGGIHLPSTFEVKNAIRSGERANRRKSTAGLLADVKTNVNVTVHVSRDADWKKFGKVLNDALGTSVNGLAQATGLV